MRKPNISFGLSVLALIISTITLCINKPSSSELGIDYLGIIVGILALLVTVLIGWQLFSLFNIEKTRNDIIKEKQTMLKEIYNNQGDICKEIAYRTLSTSTDSPSLFLDYYSFLNISFMGLYFYSKSQNKEKCISLLKLTISTSTPEGFRLNKKAKIYFIIQLGKLYNYCMIDESLYAKAKDKIQDFITV